MLKWQESWMMKPSKISVCLRMGMSLVKGLHNRQRRNDWATGSMKSYTCLVFAVAWGFGTYWILWSLYYKEI
jgi:hypothetical protein